MNKEKWGIKRVCLSCGTRFYDFNKPVILCPHCNAEFDPEYLQRRRSKTSQEKEIDDEIESVELIEDDDTEAVDEDENLPLNDAES